MSPNIRRLLKEASEGFASEEDLRELTRLLVLSGYYFISSPQIENRDALLKKSDLSPLERDWVLRAPFHSFSLAKKDKGPQEDTRIGCSKSAEFSYRYALEIDKGPHETTRRGVCKDPRFALAYAQGIDKEARDDTRTAACKDLKIALQYAIFEGGGDLQTKEVICVTPENSYLYARDVQKGPCNLTRKICCQDRDYALLYAEVIDKAPHKDTRESIITDPKGAYTYALNIDKGPHEDTRKYASQSPHFSFLYFIFIDQSRPHPVTREGVKGSEYEKRYQNALPPIFSEASSGTS